MGYLRTVESKCEENESGNGGKDRSYLLSEVQNKGSTSKQMPHTTRQPAVWASPFSNSCCVGEGIITLCLLLFLPELQDQTDQQRRDESSLALSGLGPAAAPPGPWRISLQKEDKLKCHYISLLTSTFPQQTTSQNITVREAEKMPKNYFLFLILPPF